MAVWTLNVDTTGASQAAFDIYPHGADQPVGEDVAQCVGIRVVSFNFGIPQTMLESDRRWNRQHLFTVRDVLVSLGQAATNDFVLCSEMGDSRKGFRAANVDFQHVVHEALPGADCASSGAYLSIWNIQKHATAVVESGTWTVVMAHCTDMHWVAYDLTYRDARPLADREDRDAAQLADRDALKVGLVVGNLHIPVGRASAPKQATRRKIVQQALEHLTSLEVRAWRKREDFQVMRLLVGDCNLKKEAARAVTQDIRSPPLTALQRHFNVCKWQVCDVQFPRQVLEAARRQ